MQIEMQAGAPRNRGGGIAAPRTTDAIILALTSKLRQRRQDRSALASWEDDGGAHG